jgi:ankyrin repeat protein
MYDEYCSDSNSFPTTDAERHIIPSYELGHHTIDRSIKRTEFASWRLPQGGWDTPKGTEYEQGENENEECIAKDNGKGIGKAKTEGGERSKTNKMKLSTEDDEEDDDDEGEDDDEQNRGTKSRRQRSRKAPTQKVLNGQFYRDWKRAISKDDVEEVIDLLNLGYNINSPITADSTTLPLRDAAMKSPRITRRLLESGASIDHTEDFSGTALQRSISDGSNKHKREIVTLLLENGANVNAPAGYVGTALVAAVEKNDEAIMDLLLRHGADVNQEGGYNYGTPLITAVEFADITVVKKLLDLGADANAVATYGYSNASSNALLKAIERSDKSILKLLLERGANCNLKVSYAHLLI